MHWHAVIKWFVVESVHWRAIIEWFSVEGVQ
jgi:hypothetical protein